MIRITCNLWQASLISVIAFGLCVACGCERVPRVTMVSDTTPIDESVVTASGRGGYDWFFVDGKFPVTPPSGLKVFSEIDQERLSKNLIPLKYEPPQAPVRPEGLSDAMYGNYARLVDPYFDTKPFLTIPFESKHDEGFRVNRSGDRLVKLGSEPGSQLETWDLKTSQLLWKVPLPSPSCRSLVIAGNEHAIVWDSNAAYRVTLSSGEVVAKWAAPQGQTLVQFVGAREIERFAALTESRELYALDENLRVTREYDGPRLTEPRISMRHDGTWVAGISEGKITRWKLSAEGAFFEPPNGVVDAGSVPLSGIFFDYLIGPQACQLFTIAPDGQLKYQKIELCVRTHSACLGTLDNNQEWMTICFSQRDASGTRNYFLQDHFFEGASYAEPFPLGPTPVLEISANQRTTVIAVRDAKELRLYRKDFLKSTDVSWPLQVFAQLAVAGHFEEVDRVAKAIRKLGRLRRGTGEGYYSALTQQLAQTWISLENSNQLESSKGPLQNLDEGLNAGLELAVLAAAVRDHANLGAGRDHTPGQLDWDVIHARRESAKLALAEVLSGEHPPALAFRTALALGCDMGESPEELQPLIKRYIELHPNASGGHSVLCLHMTPHQAGAAGEGGAYIAAVGSLLPQTYSDLLYLRATHTLVDRYGHDIASPQKSGLSLSRLLQSADRLLESEDLTRSEVIFLMELASRYSRIDTQTRLAKYYLQNFQVIEGTTNVLNFLLKSRAEMEQE